MQKFTLKWQKQTVYILHTRNTMNGSRYFYNNERIFRMSDFQWPAYGLYGVVFKLCFDGLVSSSLFFMPIPYPWP